MIGQELEAVKMPRKVQLPRNELVDHTVTRLTKVYGRFPLFPGEPLLHKILPVGRSRNEMVPRNGIHLPVTELT